MILIGSKPYKLELNNIIDNFEQLVRFNMAIKNNIILHIEDLKEYFI